MQPLGWFKSVGLIAAASISALPFIFFSKVAQSQSSASAHLTMGNPSNARGTTPFNYLMVKHQYALSYNRGSHIPNWVSWKLNNGWLGSVPRNDNFRADQSLPNAFYRVSRSDYLRSGFDRGHMTPSADRTNTVSNNSATFLMTNMIPQAADNNQGPWASLEAYSRSLVLQGKELYIIAGGRGKCGTGRNGRTCSFRAATNRRHLISVPARTWKVIVVLDRPGSGVRGVTRSTRVIAVDIPNIQGIRSNRWQDYRISVDTLERRTAYDFLSAVPQNIQNVIEARVDNR
jgi:endonuclease G